MGSGQSQHPDEPHEEVGDCLWETAGFVDMLAALLHELAIWGRVTPLTFPVQADELLRATFAGDHWKIGATHYT